MKKNYWLRNFVIGTFVTLYLVVSTISTIHSVEFFKLANPDWLAISLAIAFEIGAAASLAGLIILDKVNKNLVWSLFILLTLMQAMSNVYYSYVNLGDYLAWSELFSLIDYEVIAQKRIISIVQGLFLPLVALGFIKSLIDYIKPVKEDKPIIEPSIKNVEIEESSVSKNEEVAEEILPTQEREEEKKN